MAISKLADAIATPPSKPSFCGVCKWIYELPEEDQGAVKAAMALDSGWKTRDLATTLKNFGLPVGENQLGVHRRGNH